MRRLRISLRMFFVLFTMFVVLAAFVGSRVQLAQKQRQLIALLNSVGGSTHHELNFENEPARRRLVNTFVLDPTLPGPDWLRHRIGQEYFVDVVEAIFVESRGRDLDDDGFAEFADAAKSQSLPVPQAFAFDRVLITDRTMECLGNFTHLTSLYVVRCPGVTDAGIQHLSNLTRLRFLNLMATSITDDGLAHLSKLTNLVELTLSNTSVSDAGLHHLYSLDNLEVLDLSETEVSNDAIRSLVKRFPDCTILTP